MSSKVLSHEQLMSPNMTIAGILSSKNNCQENQGIPSTPVKKEEARVQDSVEEEVMGSEGPKFLMKPHIVLVNGKPLPVRAIVFKEDELMSIKPKIEEQAKDRVTSAPFLSRGPTQRWSHEETRKFYKLLEIFGCDFSLISSLYKDRTRLQIKVNLRNFSLNFLEQIPKGRAHQPQMDRARTQETQPYQTQTTEQENQQDRAHRDPQEDRRGCCGCGGLLPLPG